VGVPGEEDAGGITPIELTMEDALWDTMLD